MEYAISIVAGINKKNEYLESPQGKTPIMPPIRIVTKVTIVNKSMKDIFASRKSVSNKNESVVQMEREVDEEVYNRAKGIFG